MDAGILADSTTIAVAGALNATTGFPDAGDRDVLDSLIALGELANYGTTGANTARQELTSIYTGIATQVRAAEDNFDLQSMRMEDITEWFSSFAPAVLRGGIKHGDAMDSWYSTGLAVEHSICTDTPLVVGTGEHY